MTGSRGDSPLDDWERLWFLDMPVHATPTRTHGGLM